MGSDLHVLRGPGQSLSGTGRLCLDPIPSASDPRLRLLARGAQGFEPRHPGAVLLHIAPLPPCLSCLAGFGSRFEGASASGPEDLGLSEATLQFKSFQGSFARENEGKRLVIEHIDKNDDWKEWDIIETRRNVVESLPGPSKMTPKNGSQTMAAHGLFTT